MHNNRPVRMHLASLERATPGTRWVSSVVKARLAVFLFAKVLV